MDAGGNQLNIYEKNLNKNEWKGFMKIYSGASTKNKRSVMVPPL